jgi:hypothetical protein
VTLGQPPAGGDLAERAGSSWSPAPGGGHASRSSRWGRGRSGDPSLRARGAFVSAARQRETDPVPVAPCRRF